MLNFACHCVNKNFECGTIHLCNFNFKTLKDSFSIALQKYGMLENVEVDLPQFEKEDDDQDSEMESSFNFGNARRVIKDQVMAPAYVTPTLSEASQNEELIR